MKMYNNLEVQGQITADSIDSLNSPIAIVNGGTGATTAAEIRNNLGLGNTTGALPIANGGTGATTVAGILANLGIDAHIVEVGTDGYWNYFKFSNNTYIAFLSQAMTISSWSGSSGYWYKGLAVTKPSFSKSGSYGAYQFYCSSGYMDCRSTGAFTLFVSHNLSSSIDASGTLVGIVFGTW